MGKPLKLLELFGGIGACSKALERIGINYEIADYVEIDKFAVKSYNAMHGTNFEPQDITEWNKDIEVDLIMHGSPCTDFSLAGKQLGGDKGSGTRSSLMYETIRIVNKLKPKYVIWENVKNLLSKKHRHNFDTYLETMEQLGYKNYYQVLNAKDYGIPQNRERVFTISILDGESFEFPAKKQLELRLRDMLEDEVDEKYYLSEEYTKRFTKSIESDKFPFGNEYKVVGTTKAETERIGTNSRHWVYDTNYCMSTLEATMYKQPKQILEPSINQVGMPDIKGNEQIRMVYGYNGLSQTLNLMQCGNDTGVVDYPMIYDDRDIGFGVKISDMCPTQRAARSGIKVIYPDLSIRKLTPKECWRLMGFDDSDYEKAEKVNSKTQLYKQAGNSIVVNVLEAIFNELFKSSSNKL